MGGKLVTAMLAGPRPNKRGRTYHRGDGGLKEVKGICSRTFRVRHIHRKIRNTVDSGRVPAVQGALKFFRRLNTIQLITLTFKHDQQVIEAGKELPNIFYAVNTNSMALLELVRPANSSTIHTFVTNICCSRIHLPRHIRSLPTNPILLYTPCNAIRSFHSTPIPTNPILQYSPRNTIRSFHSTPIPFKKAGKTNRTQTRDSAPSIEGEAQVTDAGKAYDFSGLESKILKSIEHLTHELSQLRAGGRFNPELLENLKLRPYKGNNETVHLRDIAQVVPKGRVISIIVNEEDVCEAYHIIS